MGMEPLETFATGDFLSIGHTSGGVTSLLI